MSSVTVCSTCSRGLHSQKKNASSVTRNSNVPSPTRPEALASSIDASSKARRVSAAKPAGAISTSFWCLRCKEQSRSQRCDAAPDASATTWTSTCLAPRTSSSTTRPSAASSPPNARPPSAAHSAIASDRSSPRATSRMPRPPPPVRAFRIALSASARKASRSDAVRTTAPRATGTREATATSRAAILSPQSASAAGGAPTKSKPASPQALENAALSDRNP
mmetsp:Transcript_29011/g.89702  ORF Transcript_29011/g.89702 Transcript_29011/m.89702 type:complete len:221 (-) Transcript_29011:162-824(-)